MATLAVQVHPKSHENKILGWKSSADTKAELSVKLTAAPESGKANQALVKLLAKELHIPKSSITIKSGQTSRHKILDIALDEDTLAQKLGCKS